MSPILALTLLQTANPYAALGASIPKAEWAAVLARIEQPPPETSALALRKAAAERWAHVLDRLHVLLESIAVPKAAGVDGEAVERLAQLASVAAYATFAAGKRTPATTYLLDALRLARGSAHGPSETVVFAAFARHLNDLPLKECERVRSAVDGYLEAAGLSPRERSDLSLLRLHLRIETYRWQRLKLPPQLADAAPLAETLEPSTERPYRYEVSPTGYRLWSETFGMLGQNEKSGSRENDSVRKP